MALKKVEKVVEPKLAPEVLEAVTREGSDAKASIEMLSKIQITTKEVYEEIGAFLIDAKGKFKFLDEERKITVTPLNDEVKRVNDWYRPALEALKKCADLAMQAMARYELEQRAKEQRLLKEAEEAAKKVLEAAQAAGAEPGVKTQEIQGAQMQATGTLVKQAADALPPKVGGISTKPVWVWQVKDAAALLKFDVDGKFTKRVPDVEALEKWVAEHGDKDVPAGVEVKADVKFRVAT